LAKLYYKDEYCTLLHGEAIETMQKMIEKGLKFDAIITDPPYGTTQCKWDVIIPLDQMWESIFFIRKNNSVICLFGKNPFTSLLNVSNIKEYRYELIWEKEQATNFLFLKNQFGQCTENISIFYKNQPIYNPQMIKTDKPIKSSGGNSSNTYKNQTFIGNKEIRYEKYPLNILKFNRDKKTKHPTQKPILLMEYLIKTYTNEGDTILDFTCGSGTTLVAAKNLKRKCYGIEKEEKYCEITKNRLEKINNAL